MNVNKFTKFVNKTRKFYVTVKEFKRISNFGVRTMSTNVSVSQIDKEKQSFQNVWQDIVHSLVTNQRFSQLPEVGAWTKEVLEYNLSGGKKIRGLTAIRAYKMLEKPENITEDSLKLICVAGWCTELMQAYLLILDDMMDSAATRRGATCWYRKPDVGLGAINDSILVYCSMSEILKMYFGNTPQYTTLMELFNETLLYTSMGQHLDYTMSHRNRNDYSLYTIERYESIIKYKTAYYTIKLPIFLALLLKKNGNKSSHELIENICLDIGKIFQIQDDMLDAFGETAITGKVGTDIQEGKCTWLAVQALQNCSESQRRVFEENYASHDPVKVERIKQLYEELQLREIYKHQESMIYKSVLEQLQRLPSDISPDIFYKLLEMLSKRKN